MIKNVKNYFILFIYALCLALLWGTCFRGYETSKLTCGIGLVLTYVSTYFIQREFEFKLDVRYKLFFLALMAAYSSIFIKSDGIRVFLFSPQLLGLLFIGFNFFVFIDLRKFYNNIFFVLLTIIYTNEYFMGYHSYYWGELDEKRIIIDGLKDKNEERRQEIPDDAIDISTFLFMDLNSDTVTIQTKKPYVFIETWNETCYPCKKAIKELVPILDTMNNVESYFIYENKKFDKSVFISSTKKIKNLSNQYVLADFNQDFFKSSKMVAYPTFMIIDIQKRKIIYMSVGYGGVDARQKWVEKLREISKM